MFTYLKQLLKLILVLVFKPSKKDLPIDKMGVNCFFNVPELGSVQEQERDINENLNINKIRILCNWDNASQYSKDAAPNLSFTDNVLNNLQLDSEIIMVIASCPTWLEDIDPAKRIDYFISFCESVMSKYKDNPRVVGYQIGNEPNSPGFPSNRVLDFLNPDNYLLALARAYRFEKELGGSKLILLAATTSIVQSYRDTIEYNERLLSQNVEKFCDVYCIHYYGDRSFVNFMRPNGAYQFMKRIKRHIWITEIGENSFNKHVDYARVVIPYLLKTIPNIKRLYWYQYDGAGSTESFGLKNANGALSRLYAYISNKNG